MACLSDFNRGRHRGRSRASRRFSGFRKIVEKSGYRTIRIVADEDFTDELLREINALGCSFEGATSRYVAIDVPAHVELENVAAFLIGRDIRFEYADPTYEDLYGSTDL